MDPSPERQLGDYSLKKLLGQTSSNRTWLAEQRSIRRQVLIDELTDIYPKPHADFFAAAQAKAAVHFPKIGSVYEAIDEPGMSFCVYELLPGKTLAELQLSGQALQAVSLVSILQHVAEANIYLENTGRSTTLLGLEDIHVEESGVVRVKNLAVAGPRQPSESSRDIAHLGEQLRGLVAKDWPGANRVSNLLGWMRGEEVEQSLTWMQVRDYCEEISNQLSHPGSRRESLKLPKFVVPALLSAILIGLGIVAWSLLPEPRPKVKRLVLPPPIEVKAGSYRNPNGGQQDVPAFMIEGHVVTNEEYMTFLKIVQVLAKDGDGKLFDHPEQPESKVHHEPAGWATLSVLLTKSPSDPLLDQPVTGVDWWDAYAYSNWKKTRLPTQEEWFIALEGKASTSLSEWTQAPAANPANPLGEKLWVLVRSGKPREWLPDRSIRRTDLGFRVMVPVK